MMTDSATKMQAASAAKLEAAGKAAVRALLIDPLETLGLTRPHGIKLDTHRARLDALAARLSYMSPGNLTTLADVVASQAARTGGAWPSPVVVEGWAQGLQARPYRESDIMRSWLASIEGPIARAGGWLVPLFRFLRRRMVPPGPKDQRDFRTQADDDTRTRRVYEQRMENGTATADERAWVEAYLRDEQTALDIVAQGDARRAAKAAAQEGQADDAA